VNRVLITGAAGGIGRGIRPLLRGVYPSIRLSDIVEVQPEQGEEFARADLAAADPGRELRGRLERGLRQAGSAMHDVPTRSKPSRP
jgi:nucleoside-diphosphate-sugar epimerase